MLIIFSGLPATGKTTIGRELARQIGAIHLRIDSIEQAIRDCSPDAVGLDEAGYRVAYAVAEDNLRIGRTVVADSVNPLQITRDAWLEVGRRAQAITMEIEVICSDPRKHRARVETRKPDIFGLSLPTWEQVISREYHPWHREHIVIDTANRTLEQNIETLREALPPAIVDRVRPLKY
ncbi:MAG TPA: AAA family ATPase [Candidatus Sulfotelmatobacter sp.]|nr:AAA family ATPase [Candidatus Sulfotelmatobacter sp.]